ncbi:MAG: DUF790 family protein [Candidatus Hydrothermarchaeaceae archaeon]
MLPSDMLVTRTRRGDIHPVFAVLSKDNLGIASDLIGTYKGSIGRKQGEIKAELEEIETAVKGIDYRFVRGLDALLLRRCEFEVESALNPELARRTVFEEANLVGAITTGEKRAEVLNRAARGLGVTVEELEASLWADREDELVLHGFREITPEELLGSYNLSLAQTLLFKATSMEVWLGGNYQRVFRKIKYLGLMYHCEKMNGKLRVTIDGPLALFKMTEKYGTALAKLLPDIAASTSWTVKADIVRRGYDRTPRSLRFELDSRSAPLMRTGYEEFGRRGEVRKESYDSTVEEKFARAFAPMGTGWSLTREPEPLMAGNSVFIPDFLFRKGGMSLYMEVVGFWTEDYLKKKLYKLQQLGMEDLLIAVDKKLACSEFKALKGEVIYYEKKVPVKDVLGFLRRHEERAREKELVGLSQKDIVLRGDVIHVAELAKEYDVSKEAIEERVKGVEGYHLVGGELVSQEKMERVKKRLEELPLRAKYTIVEKLLLEEGISSVNSLLGHLGYGVEWPTLDPNDAVVTRKQKEG